MFSNKSFDVVGFNSCWKTERKLQDEEVQTEDCSFQMKESQTNISLNVETQTDNSQLEIMVPEKIDYDKLAAFLRYVGPLVITELDRCNKSRAFDSYEPMDDDMDGAVKKLYDLQIPNFSTFKDMYVSGLSWFCSGSVIACSYAFMIHEDWCEHTGCIYIFNINRSSSSPSRTLETGGCVSCLCAHPYKPSMLAAGLYTGEVIIWNFKNHEPVIDSSKFLVGSHRDVVTQLSWIHNTDSSQKLPLLVSSSSDGRILIWYVGTQTGVFRLNEAFVITQECIRYLSLDTFVPSPVGIAGSGMEIEINCFSFSTLDPTCFVIGIDGGIILYCSTFAAKPAPVDADVPLKDPVLKAFDKHQGKVSCVQCSPHKEAMFVSCGTDKEIRVYLMTQSSPIHVMHTEAAVLHMEWSLAYPQILATCGNDKDTIDFYNLHTKKIVPSLQIPNLEKSAEISAMHWNPQNHHMIAVGDVCGRIIIWQMCSYKRE